MSPQKLAEIKAELQSLRAEAEREAEETFEERMEDAAHKGIEAQRNAFEEVTQRTGLHGNRDLAAELSEMLTRPGTVPSSQKTHERPSFGAGCMCVSAARGICTCTYNVHDRYMYVCGATCTATGPSRRLQAV